MCNKPLFAVSAENTDQRVPFRQAPGASGCRYGKEVFPLSHSPPVQYYQLERKNLFPLISSSNERMIARSLELITVTTPSKPGAVPSQPASRPNKMRILGYSTQEIAALYGMRPNVVAAWVSRARQMTAGGSVHENRRRSLCAGFVKGKYYTVIGRFPPSVRSPGPAASHPAP